MLLFVDLSLQLRLLQQMCIRDSLWRDARRRRHDDTNVDLHHHHCCAPRSHCLRHRILYTPVSYTHLDVYKRQAFVVCGGTFILCLLEPDLTFLQLLFEATSAFGTVGLSTGITPQLQPASKLIVILIMYTGRIGPLTVASLWAFRTEQHVWYSEETITIG